MKIKFKSHSEVDLKKIFPVIDSKDFDLIADQELVITPEQVKKLKKNKFLNLSGFHISEDLIYPFEEDLESIQEEILEKVNEKFIYAEDVVDVLIAGVENSKNVLLWGKGGHGKSEISELVLKELYNKKIIKEEPFVQAFGDGLTEEKLFGGMNIKKYKEEGVIEYLPENSFMNYEVVVFEEIFDAPASVLLSLKDIMTSGKFRQGNEIFNIKTKVIIGLTNKSKKDFAEKDESLKALAERFPLTLNVEWKHYKKTNFLKLFQKVLGEKVYKDNTEKLSELANIIDMNNAQGASFVSPRTAVAAAELFLKGKKLEYISEIDKDILQKYRQTQTSNKFDKLHKELLSKIEEYMDIFNLDSLDQDEEFLKQLSDMEVEVGGEPLDISFLDKSSKNKNRIKYNKANFLLSIINQAPIQVNNQKKFQQLKARLNEVIQLTNTKTTDESKTEIKNDSTK